MNPHAIPQAAPGVLSAIEQSTLPLAKALEIPKLLASASLPPIAAMIAHGVGTKVDSHH